MAVVLLGLVLVTGLTLLGVGGVLLTSGSEEAEWSRLRSLFFFLGGGAASLGALVIGVVGPILYDVTRKPKAVSRSPRTSVAATEPGYRENARPAAEPRPEDAPLAGETWGPDRFVLVSQRRGGTFTGDLGAAAVAALAGLSTLRAFDPGPQPAAVNLRWIAGALWALAIATFARSLRTLTATTTVTRYEVRLERAPRRLFEHAKAIPMRHVLRFGTRVLGRSGATIVTLETASGRIDWDMGDPARSLKPDALAARLNYAVERARRKPEAPDQRAPTASANPS